jgi:hypothetical protein
MKKFIIYLIALLLTTSCDVNLSHSESYSDISSISTGGSLASFVITGDYLYTINGGQLESYNISNPSAGITKTSNYITNNDGDKIYDLETIFPYKGHLFLGASSGMHIVDVSSPSYPTYVSEYEHVVSCDPVVVQDSIAYVTLRSSDNWCWREVNELQTIDISDLENPRKINSFPMTSPYGLGVDGDLLFVCDNNKLKVLNCSDPNNVRLNETHDVSAKDVITYNNLLMILGNGALSQYSYENSKMTLLSTIDNK